LATERSSKLAATAKKMKRRRTERKTHPRQKGNNKILLSESFIMWLQAINFGASSQMQQQRCQ